MSKRDWKLLLEDMLESITPIEEYTEKINKDEFINNQMIVDAVVRNIEIIGEASKNVPDPVREKYADIPWKKLNGIRNRIVHAYFGVDSSIIWFIIENELSSLKQSIHNALREIEGDSVSE
jgi:uncharacterized protein with HEPN domain